VYKFPETQRSWGSWGIDAWCISLLLDHYHCNHFFDPKTQAYRLSSSPKLFPQHCQVLFLIWNKHLQEVSDKLVTTLMKLPVHKRLGVLANIKNQLAIETMPTTKRTLTYPTHEWLLPPGNLQRVPIVAHPEQRVEQRVTSTHPDKLPTLQCVREAPPIVAAPNPTTHRILKATKQTHLQTMWNNVPGSILAITCSLSICQPLPVPTQAPIEVVPWRLPWTSALLLPQTAMRIPRVCF
jgi:hypothetical protein